MSLVSFRHALEVFFFLLLMSHLLRFSSLACLSSWRAVCSPFLLLFGPPSLASSTGVFCCCFYFSLAHTLLHCAFITHPSLPFTFSLFCPCPLLLLRYSLSFNSTGWHADVSLTLCSCGAAGVERTHGAIRQGRRPQETLKKELVAPSPRDCHDPLLMLKTNTRAQKQRTERAGAISSGTS